MSYSRLDRTLFVTGFSPRTRAKTLAYEFERYGRLVRLDIPPPKSQVAKPFAFVEYEQKEDAQDAFTEMHGRSYNGHTLRVTWARTSLFSDQKRPPPRRNQSPPRRRSRSP